MKVYLLFYCHKFESAHKTLESAKKTVANNINDRFTETNEYGIIGWELGETLFYITEADVIE